MKYKLNDFDWDKGVLDQRWPNKSDVPQPQSFSVWVRCFEVLFLFLNVLWCSSSKTLCLNFLCHLFNAKMTKTWSFSSKKLNSHWWRCCPRCNAFSTRFPWRANRFPEMNKTFKHCFYIKFLTIFDETTFYKGGKYRLSPSSPQRKQCLVYNIYFSVCDELLSLLKTNDNF